MVKESFDVRFYHEMMSAKLQLVAQGFDGIVCAHSWPVAIAARQKIHFVYSPAGFVSLPFAAACPPARECPKGAVYPCPWVCIYVEPTALDTPCVSAVLPSLQGCFPGSFHTAGMSPCPRHWPHPFASERSSGAERLG